MPAAPTGPTPPTARAGTSSWPARPTSGRGKLAGTAMSQLPVWAEPDLTWAPSVLAIDGRWVLYYTARHAASNRQCIGRAVSGSPRGPFTDQSSQPLVCQLDQGGSIDPSPFIGADGQPYLVWKAEGEVVGGVSSIWVQRLDATGLSLVDEPARIAHADRRWEGGIVEGPSMRFVGGRYHLVYSANSWDTADYAVGHAACAGPTGPCRKNPSPVLTTDGARTGPGGAEFFHAADASLHVAYHAWVGDEIGYPHRRTLRTRPVRISGPNLSL
ncbi:MAG: glycoside hydrolase family 43 protein [Acidimicrobiia bacterium]|nr:glycoside hydrolase family 43 protein [Acidimicrobiia bacterium]